MNIIFFVTMYEILKTELERDITWKGVDIDSALKRTKLNDTLRNRSMHADYSVMNRYDRCATRRLERLSGLKTQNFDNFNSFLDGMYEIQYYKGFKPIDDFMDCVCCPLIYDSKSMLFKKLKPMITNISERSKHSVIKKHKIFNKYLLCGGITISMHLLDIISLNDAHLILNNIDKLSLCQNCTYAVMCIAMYETTSFIEYKDIIYNDTSFMFHRSLINSNKALYDSYLKTKNIYYLKHLENTLCDTTAWYTTKLSVRKYIIAKTI